MTLAAPVSTGRRRRLELAAILGTLALSLGVVTLGLVLLALDWPRSLNAAGQSGTPVLGYAVMAAAFGACGAAVAWRRPDNPLGWLYLGGGLLLTLALTTPVYAFAIFQMHHALPGRAAAAALGNWSISILALYLFLGSALVFPTGRLLSRGWRTAVAVIVLGFLVSAITIALTPGRAYPGVGAPNPLGVRAGWVHGLETYSVAPALVVPAMLAVGALVVRWRRGSGLERLQIRWPASTSVSTLVLFFVTWFLPPGWPLVLMNYLVVVGFAAIPVSVLVAISRYRLYDLDRLISRAVAYATVTALLGGVYAAAVTVATRVLPFSTPLGVAAATLLAAALFNPLRRRAQRLVDRQFNRTRYDSQATVAAFANRLRARVELESVRADLLATVAGATQPLHISVWLRGSEHAAEILPR